MKVKKIIAILLTVIMLFSNMSVTSISTLAENTEKMFVISPNAIGETKYANVFVPLDFLEVDGKRLHSQENDEYYYFKLNFKLKLINGKMPIVGIIRYAYWTNGAQSEFNYVNNNQDSHSDTLLFSKYNEETLTYTAVIKMWINPDPQSGVHSALTIGNMEHNNSWHKEKNFDAHFAFASPELFAYDINKKETFGENLLPEITESNFTNKIYFHPNNGYNGLDAILKAPANKWSIDTTSSLISLKDIPDGYFTKDKIHSYIKIPTKLPTMEEVGYKQHFICNCSECVGKYFLNNGKIEVSWSELEIPVLTAPGDSKMIVVSPNFSGGTKIANAFIPLNFRNAGGVYFDSDVNDEYYYFKLSFNVRLLGDSLPIVGMMRYNPYGNLGSWSEFNHVNNNQLDHSDKILMSEYDPETMMFTAIVKMWISDKYCSSPTGAHSAITIGNAEHNNSWRSENSFETSFAFGNPTLYAYNTTTGETYGENLIADITIDTINDSMVYQHPENDYAGYDNIMAAPANMWSIDNQKSMITFSEIPENYFVPTKGTPNMVMFAGSNASEGVGNNGKIYQILNLKAGKNYRLSYNVKYSGMGLAEDKLGGQLEYCSGGALKELTAVKSESDTEYKEIFEFTMPSDADSGNNFKFTFNYSSMFTSGYMANFDLYELDADGNAIGQNLFKNGDFSIAVTAYWVMQGKYYLFNALEIPENFFSKTESVKPNMVVYRNTSDYAQIYQTLTLKPDTTYELKYKDLHTDYVVDKKPYNIIYQFYYNDKGKVENDSMPKEDVKETVDGNCTTKVFTTTDKLRKTGENNILIRFYMRSGSAGFWGPVELYELDENGNRIGNNLFLNHDFTFGISAWQSSGNVNYRISELPDGFFENYKEPQNMVYSNGEFSNQIYKADVKISPDKKYYYWGYLVNKNSVGITPQIKYLSNKNVDSGVYEDLDAEMFYDSDRQYFEFEFEVPDDALIVDGLASISLQINNHDFGKGFFANLAFDEEGKYNNLLSDFDYENKNYQVLEYNRCPFVYEYHNYGNWVIRNNQTCTENGEKYRNCTACNKEETKVIPANHDFSIYYTVDTKPTEFAEGSKSRHCLDCDAITDVKVIEKLQSENDGEELDSTNLIELRNALLNGTDYRTLFDYNKDGLVNSIDVVRLKKILAGFVFDDETNQDTTPDSKPDIMPVDDMDLDELLEQMSPRLKGSTLKVYSWNPIDAVPGAEKVISDFEKKTGIDVSWTVGSYDTYETEIAMLINSGNSPDIIRYNIPRPDKMYLTQDLKTATGFDFKGSIWDESVSSAYTIKDKLYGVNLKNTLNQQPLVVTYAKSTIDKYNLEDPYILWKNGEWTYDKFIEMCKEFKEQTNRPAWMTSEHLEPLWFNNVNIIKFQGGWYKNTISEANVRESLQQSANLLADGITCEAMREHDKLEDGECLFFTTNIRVARGIDFFHFPTLKANDDLYCVPVPTGFNDTYYQHMSEYEAYGIAKGAKNPQAVYYFLRYYLDADNYDKDTFFMNKQNYEVYNYCMSQNNVHYTLDNYLYNGANDFLYLSEEAVPQHRL